jgi:trehalose synthase
VLDGVRRARALLADRTVWNVNSTGRGGGVAEMLQSLLAYARGAGLDVRWDVIAGDARFFTVTKRLHNRLHGEPGDGGPLDAAARADYEATTGANADELARLVGPDDIVLLHDPQTAGMIPRLKRLGVPVVWRCHVGIDAANDDARAAWDFLRGYVREADAYIFSRRQYAWSDLDPDRIALIAPAIDAFSAKNQDMSPAQVGAILATAGIQDDDGHDGRPTFTRFDGSTGSITRMAVADRARPLRLTDSVVLQVSRWDRLKDPLGVITGFAAHVAPHTDAHLVYAGPDVDSVTDDPEGADVLARALALRSGLPAAARDRVHLVTLPMADVEENAAMVNALQRRADVVVQKSIAEGFGLTVAEAMWKARPVVASRIGGIQDQIEHGRSGMLLDDPSDLATYGQAVVELLSDAGKAAAIGREASQRVSRNFLGTRDLLQYVDLFERLLQRTGPPRATAVQPAPNVAVSKPI